MGCLSRDAILAVEDLPREYVEVPEWGGGVWVRTMTGSERDRWERQFVDEQGKPRKSTEIEHLRAALVVHCVVDDNGQKLFDEADIPALGAKSGKALDRLFAVAQRLNGFRKEDIEELAGN